MLSRREARAHSSNNFIFDHLFFFSYKYNQVLTRKMAEALISVLLEQLVSAVYQHTNEAVKLVLNADKDVKSFSSKLKAIQAVLEDAEKKQVTEASVGDWLQKLKDVSYEMDDVLDEWNIELLRQQAEEKQEVEGDNALVTKKKVRFPMSSGCFCFGQVNKVIHHHNIARRIKELNEKLTLIAAEREMYGFHQSTIGDHHERFIQRQTSSLVDVSAIFGREEEKEYLLSKLLRESNQDGGRFLVIPIVGMGGMGKTTLAQLAYNNEKVTAHFNKKVWVCVSDPFDEVKIAKAIIENLDRTQSGSNELEILLQSIKRRVEDEKFLLVLDDVWTEDHKKWENLKLPIIMQSCAKGSTILVTTRKEGVAKMMRATKSTIHLDKLSDKDCLALFNSFAFLDKEEDEANGFGAIGEEIVKKCKGLPLAAKTLGSVVLHKKTREEWQNVLNSKIWELEEVEEQVFRPLLLSYYDLAPAVKRCLLYCAIFPKDYDFKKDNLIELWMSQDYLNSKGKKEKRRIGQYYFESLAMRSFFQDFEKDEMGNIIECKMHDIVHDFVLFLSKNECIIIEAIEGINQRIELSSDKIRHLTLISVPEGPLPTLCYGCKNMRSLILLHSSITTISRGSIIQMKCLRTLNLSGNKISGSMLNEVPKEIGELIHLRYMDLSHNWNLKELPDAMCELYNLQTLVLVYTCLWKLPKAMGKLINLKHLYVGGCGNLRYLPKGIGSLKSLQVLDWFKVCEGDDEALKLGNLGVMDQLQGSLDIRGLGKDDASEIEKALLGNKEHLSHLGVGFQFALGEQRKGDSEIVKALQPHQNLESLTIRCCHGTTESLYWIKSLHNLRKLYLSYWEFCEVLPPLGKLPSLEILDIWEMKKVKKVRVEFLGIEEEEEEEEVSGILFPKLKKLTFFGMKNWEEWALLSEITIMPRLSELRIKWCPKLKALPKFLYKIPELRTLEIKGCPILEGEYEKGVGKEWHNISHIPNLTIQSGWKRTYVVF
ncbi:putative P-loop containing nucleoside triphosphate hydrolase, leucine-rich repeat domain, L [Rosa chinensis]|uniref:Putative P-loop containing nucleoside triphosphate hydrolase, leucine-rich repeat domain, L n=1 Tax=Rosa chinensis TaxID=74649 RepID=A0A2P6PF80_ROSCH|nr:disease resistance protein RGA2 [Rosa chinensis]XP_040366172.1 disease resistance protein RGA2 [Rosa chinensis]XP_040366173.1 disease resistance protein RGA2 [Rosa chinensis]XP_040366174.1 disease resistance protein RGA2 [Rosa chinensis]XP_040366175.1 disease resistance protein RGA2 [Rosa chinensis]XP_040366176.1 disease resistance protein RGA2 [Rosa chinensis]XP_040366177.1 disease resistance protein RGA2 [Rosa chinensis]XP_040366178.1 disease resistance protein RGA2 [Rosa chinensis]XP_